jgi:chromosome segregation ATPase
MSNQGSAAIKVEHIKEEIRKITECREKINNESYLASENETISLDTFNRIQGRIQLMDAEIIDLKLKATQIQLDEITAPTNSSATQITTARKKLEKAAGDITQINKLFDAIDDAIKAVRELIKFVARHA